VGRTTVVVAPASRLSDSLANALDALVVDADPVLPLGIDGVVVVVGSDAPSESAITASISDDESHRIVDAMMWRALAALQSARSAFERRAGRIVVVLPTIGMAGAARLVAYTTAIEGIRAMAKSAARQWRSEGIVVNLVAAPLHLFAPEFAYHGAHLTAAAMDDESSLLDSVISTTQFLLRADIEHLVGATIIVDGGSVMLP
jgi:3-oxoacyl-[acyl-carrier protein] reductase